MEKFEAITILLSAKTSKLSQTKWNKLIFFIDGAYFTQKNITPTGFSYIKMPYGPVPNNYRFCISSMAHNKFIRVTTNEDISDSVRIILPPKKLLITEAEDIISKDKLLLEIVEKVIEIFGDWTAVKLSNFSHTLEAWINAEMYSEIKMSSLKKDKFLKKQYGIASFGKLLLNQ